MKNNPIKLRYTKTGGIKNYPILTGSTLSKAKSIKEKKALLDQLPLVKSKMTESELLDVIL